MTSSGSQTDIIDILQLLDDDQLFALARTITQGLLKNTLNTKKDAIDIIIKYSSNEVSILRRKAITKDILFTYLHNNKVSVSIPVTKDKLIDHVCALWKIQNSEVQQTTQTVCVKDTAETVEINDVNQLAQQFSAWFYEMLNKDELIETTHFYQDAKLKLNIYSSEANFTENAFEPEAIVHLLYEIRSRYDLMFNPNLTSEGVQGKIDVHGLVIILSCGTLHSKDSCVGAFEQVFSLARDPYCENNWKIKAMEANLRSQSVSKLPALQDCEMPNELVSITEVD